MATKYLYLEGIAQWTKAKEPDEKYNNYSIDLYVTPEADANMKQSGAQLTRREDDKGVYYKIKRPHEGIVSGEKVEWGPPAVRIVTGNELEPGVPETTPFDGLVGNGSKVTLKLAVYDTKKGKGTRWEALRVDELVEYNPDNRTPTPEYPF